MSSSLQELVDAKALDMTTYAVEIRQDGASDYLDDVIEVDSDNHSVLLTYGGPTVSLEFESPDTARIEATHNDDAARAYLVPDDADTIYHYYFED